MRNSLVFVVSAERLFGSLFSWYYFLIYLLYSGLGAAPALLLCSFYGALASDNMFNGTVLWKFARFFFMKIDSNVTDRAREGAARESETDSSGLC